MMPRRSTVATLRLGEDGLDVLADALAHYRDALDDVPAAERAHDPARVERVQGAVLRARLKLDGVR